MDSIQILVAYCQKRLTTLGHPLIGIFRTFFLSRLGSLLNGIQRKSTFPKEDNTHVISSLSPCHPGLLRPCI